METRYGVSIVGYEGTLEINQQTYQDLLDILSRVPKVNITADVENFDEVDNKTNVPAIYTISAMKRNTTYTVPLDKINWITEIGY